MTLTDILIRLTQHLRYSKPEVEIKVKLIKRDEIGSVTKVKYLPISYMGSTDPFIAVENSDIEESEWD